MLVLTKTHEAFYEDQVFGVPPSGMLIQPCNRGTAPAIIYSLLHLREMDPDGIVAFFPSDHHFSDDEAFSRHMESAYAAAACLSEQVILLGIPPDSPEVEYGWIEPGSLYGWRRAEFRFSREPILGETAPEICGDSDGARLSLEQLRHGWPCQRFPELHPADPSRPCLAHLNPSVHRFRLHPRKRNCASFTPAFSRPAFLRTSCRCDPRTSPYCAPRVSAGAISENQAVSSRYSRAKVPRQTGASLRALNSAGRLGSKVLGYGLERTEA